MRIISRIYFMLILTLGICFQVVKAQDIEQMTKSKAFEFRGAVNLGLSAYASNRETPRYSPFSYTISGAPTFILYGFEIPLNFTFSEQQRSFRQPFNRFGLSPNYKWIKVHLGHRNLNFNKYTLGGHILYGAAIELTPGKFRIGAAYGRLNKAVNNVQGIESFIEPSFERKGLAFKFGYGSNQNNIEFTTLKAKDDFTLPIDTSLTSELRPEENFVISLSTQLTFWKKLSFNLNTAASAYTTNVFSQEIEDDYKQKELIKKIMIPRLSTRLKIAGDASLDLNLKNFSIGFGYKRIDPEFASMGTYRFLTDIEDFTVNPSFSIFKNKINVSGSYGLQRNNLLGQRLQDSNRIIGAINLSLSNVGSFAANLSYNNYKTDLVSATEVVLSDSFNIIQVSENIQFGSSYQIKGSNNSNISLNLFHQIFNNESLIADANLENISRGIVVNYTYRLSKNKLAFQTGLNFNTTSAGEIINDKYGLRLGVSQKIAKQLNWGVNVNANSNIRDKNATALSLIGRLRLSYKLNKKSSLSFTGQVLNRIAIDASEKEFQDLRAQLNYALNF